MSEWWDRGGYSSKSKNYSSSSSTVSDGAEDLADTVNENNSVLKHLFTAGGYAIKAFAEKMGEGITIVIDWRWPHE